MGRPLHASMDPPDVDETGPRDLLADNSNDANKNESNDSSTNSTQPDDQGSHEEAQNEVGNDINSPVTRIRRRRTVLPPGFLRLPFQRSAWRHTRYPFEEVIHPNEMLRLRSTQESRLLQAVTRSILTDRLEIGEDGLICWEGRNNQGDSVFELMAGTGVVEHYVGRMRFRLDMAIRSVGLIHHLRIGEDGLLSWEGIPTDLIPHHPDDGVVIPGP
ncbi:hypothetical protein LX32DRAFT_93484 [Colletotrichum zoysiae]|uniref:Uncharacterized protein n=1 Tax=Colletotrichum zoysiae TaxID=1216348 RepID=A0AAD9H8Y6_9PEZI|nr:hypothetical protein LX32DRAFT_93484 [Colletotrichum zoysiae]